MTHTTVIQGFMSFSGLSHGLAYTIRHWTIKHHAQNLLNHHFQCQ